LGSPAFPGEGHVRVKEETLPRRESVCKIPKLLGRFQAWERALCQALWADFTVHCGPMLHE